MRIICGPRQCGKSSRIVDWVKTDPSRVIIVSTEDKKNALIEVFGVLKEQIRVIESPKLKRPIYTPGTNKAFIDGAESYLRAYFQEFLPLLDVRGISLNMACPIGPTDIMINED